MKHFIIILSLTLFIGAGSIFAQQQVIQGKRLPRLTTQQRDLIAVDATMSKGLIIYNTDIDCQEFWNGTVWISLCGVVNPEMDVDVDSLNPEPGCRRIRVHGTFFKDARLDNSHFISMPITVTRPGTYSLSARSDNGYFFHTSGVFEEAGTYELNLVGMGVPRETGIDQLVFTVNGAEIAILCNITAEVQEMKMGYTVDCWDIEVRGEYRVNRITSEDDHYIIVPVEVIQLGTANIRTDQQNGLRFTGSKEFTQLGPDTIILYASGLSREEGDFRYYFTTDGDVRTTCNFVIPFVSLLGTYAEPACNCLAIANERPFAPNGEYWLRDCSYVAEDSEEDDVPDDTPRYRTYCDISGGGWMLVWSYSESTAFNTYNQSTATGGTGNSGTMRMDGRYWALNASRPRNTITDTVAGVDDGPLNHQIVYGDFRLPLTMWRSVAEDFGVYVPHEIKVRIATDSTNMRCQWGNNNFVIMSPRSISTSTGTPATVNRNPLYAGSWTSATGNRVPSVGRIFGQRFEVRASGGGNGGGWAELGGNRYIRVINSQAATTGFAFSWNAAGSSTLFQVRPNLVTPGGVGAPVDNRMRLNLLRTTFTTFNSGNRMPNHHIGKCNTAGAPDFSFGTVAGGTGGTMDCAMGSLVPHSFNNGNGRYIQWWVR
ncbi:MAG: hypothetical protein LBH22_02355 [Bacteroidales bacterium]|jgi:hypothetical protein|nr:hypothetical protein [Bacteroidales bacterium]